MMSINNLFDEILENIFLRLSRHDRLTCKRVCRRWYELLMTRAIFLEDRHIYLTNCFIEPDRPPMTIFMNAQYPYQILTLKNSNIYKPFYRNFDETRDFWMQLGQHVTKINIYNNVRTDLYRILYEMPELEEIFCDSSLYEIAADLAEVHVKILDRQFPTKLKKLKIRQASIGFRHTADEILFLKRIIPSDTSLIIEGTVSLSDDQLQEVMNAMPNATIQSLRISIHERHINFLQKFLDVPSLPFDRINIDILDTNYPTFEFCKALVEKHTNIKELSFSCGGAALENRIPLPQLTSMELSFREEYRFTQKLNYLETFSNLTHLNLWGVENREDVCVFHHEPMNLPKLKELNLQAFQLDCDECVNVVASSFPLLEKYIGKCTTLETRTAQKMFKQWKNLRKFTLECRFFDLQELAEMDEFLNEPRPSLQTLSINAADDLPCNFETFSNLGRVFTNLNHLTLHFGRYTQQRYMQPELEKIVKGIMLSFNDLTRLELTADWRLEIHYNQCFYMFDHIRRYGASLRVLQVPKQVTIYPPSASVQLYQQLPTLVEYNIGHERFSKKAEDLKKVPGNVLIH